MGLSGLDIFKRTRSRPEGQEKWKRGIGDVVKSWIEWEGIDGLYGKCSNPNSKNILDAKLYFVTLFETGCRCSEAIILEPHQFRISENGIKIVGAKVFKNKKTTHRDIVIRRVDNPLAEDFIEMVKACRTKYLFPGKTPAGSIRKGFHITARTVYNRINEIDGVLFPHCLRAHRAYHLAHERDFSVNDLMKWFGWASATQPLHYTATRDMEKRLGLDKVTWKRLG